MRSNPRTIEFSLLWDIVNGLDVLQVVPNPRVSPNMPVEDAREQSRCAMEVKPAPAAIEIADSLIPDAPARGAENRPELLSVYREMSMDSSFSEHREKVPVLKCPESSQLEFEQCSLVRIQIDTIDAFGAAEEVIQRVAAGAGDHNDPVAGCDLQSPLVNNRVFPALVVDEVASVNLVEKPLLHNASIFGIVAVQ